MTAIARQSVLFGEEQAEATSDDMFTPRWVFDQLGLTFDLDVASPPGGIPWIPAKQYFTKADDALSQPWHGRVWMNPPYSQPNLWVRRFIEHGNGIALLPTSKARWFSDLWQAADGILVHEPFDFVAPQTSYGEKKSIFIMTFFAAMGDKCVEALRNLGHVR